MILSALENGKVTQTVCNVPAFDYHCDVLCIGAGSAGVYAADSAARMGADVILCEIEENIGGMSVCGNVTSYYYGMRGGSHEEDDVKSKRDTVFATNLEHWEQRQIRCTERLQESGVKILCQHAPTGLLLEGDKVIGIRAFDGTRTVYIRAHITIDATSDGHLIRMTNVKTECGRPGEQSFAPFTVRTQFFANNFLFSWNTDNGFMNQYSATDFSRNTIFAHAQNASLLPKGEFISVALSTGVREGLTFAGEERLRYEDILLGKTPEKILFWAYADLDRHGSEHATEQELFQNWWVISNLATVTVTIPVPFGSVVPKGIKGLVTAGRCFCCDSYSQSAVRMNTDMFRMGECVGIAAALASRDKVEFPEIDYQEFLAQVKKRNCFENSTGKGFFFDNTYQAYLNKMRALGRTPDAKYAHLSPRDYIREPLVFDLEKTLPLLETDAPGAAIWSCYLSEDRDGTKEKLYHSLSTAKEDLHRYNCAIALGLLEDTRALPTLREIVDKRDCFFFTDNRRSNQFRSAVAVCLLGRLGKREDVPRLLEILEKSEFERTMYHTLPANYLYHAHPDRNFVYFSMVTHACMALYKLYQKCGLPLKELHQTFQSFFYDATVLNNLTTAEKGTPAHTETQAFIRHILNLTQ